ncbi:Condensin complex subunit 2 [Sergentomyia squamirostris]
MDTASPLRRSTVGSDRTPARPILNDDREERELARRSFIDVSTTSSSEDQCETLELGLKMYHENKFTKENVWKVSLIDSFAALIRKHHESLGNFQKIGSTMEASAKLWGLRVDSTHEKTMRLNSGLGHRKTTRVENDETVDESMAQGGDTSGQQQGARPKKKKRPKSTIVTNVETINAPLDTVPLPEPIMAELRSLLESVANPTRLLCNRLMDRNGIFNLDPDAPLNPPGEPVKLDPHAKPDYSKDKWFTVSMEALKPEDRLRPMHSHYEIKNTPAEDEEEAAWEAQHLDQMNASKIALAFDMDAEVEPLAEVQDDDMAADMMEEDFPDVGGDLDEDNRAAILACKGLRRKPDIIQDLRPTESNHSHLEYSYRPMDKINQYWAGPSHWKFKKASKLSFLPRESAGTAARRSRRPKTSALARADTLAATTDDIYFPFADVKLRQKSSRKKWDQKEKLKLPTDFQFDRNMFTTYKNAPGLVVQEAPSDVAQGALPIADDYNYDNLADRSYCSNVIAHDDTDTETGTEADAGAVGGEPVESQVGEDQPRDVTIAHFDTQFLGAPEKVEKIVLPYSKRAKVVDMKQLKKAAWYLINVGSQKSDILSYKKLYNALPQHLSPLMRENLTVPLAFYSILHLTNEHGLQLVKKDNLQDFGIRMTSGSAPSSALPESQASDVNSEP